VRPSSPELVLASQALRDCGYQPDPGVSGGGSDVNALRTRGCRAINLGNGAERPHESTERVSVAALEGMLELASALVQRAGEPA
jgi:tripeptide aminopeptidase